MVVRVVLNQVVLRRHREHVAVLADGDILEHALRQARVLHELAQLLRALLDHHHGTVVDAGSVVAHEPVLFGQLHLHGRGGLAVIEHGAQLVEARIREVRGGVLRLRDDGAVARHHQHVVHAQKVLVLDHLRIGRREAGVVVRHEGHARRLGLVYLVEGDGVLLHAFVCQRQQALQCVGLLLHLARVAVQRQLGLHHGQQHAHDRHARGCHQNEDGDLDFEFSRHAPAPP